MTDRLFHRSFITENSDERILTSFYATIWIFEIATWWYQPSHWTTLALQMVRSAIKTSKHIIPWKEVLLWWKLRTTYSKDTRPCREAEYDDSLSINHWLSRDPSLLLNIQYQHYSCLHISGRDMHFVHHMCIMNMFTKIMVRAPENFIFAFIKGLVVAADALWSAHIL